MAAKVDYRRTASYVFELEDGHRITGEFRHKLFYEETTGNGTETPTGLVRNCFFRVAETDPGFFKHETYFEIVNYKVGEAAADPVSTEITADVLVAFSIGKELYGNRVKVVNILEL